MSSSAVEQLFPALQRLNQWIERENFQGWDPHDALNSALLNRLTGNNRRVGQVWVQLLKRSPVNIRPLLGIAKGYNPKGMGLFLATYWRAFRHDPHTAPIERVRFFADWLLSNQSRGYHGSCWGYNFDWPNRGFFARAGTPTIVNTAFIGLAFIDLIALPSPSVDWGDMPLKTAQSACEFMLRDLASDYPAPDERCFSYTPFDRRYVHNASVLGAWLLAEVGVRTDNSEYVKAAVDAARYTARRQQTDGSWLYGEGSQDKWVDNFHTGYVLVALKRIGQLTQTDEFAGMIHQGYHYWQQHFFGADGAPKYYNDHLYPIDTHCVAQAILTFLAFADVDPNARQRAIETAQWGVANLQDARGYFHYQIQPYYRIRIPYIRWTQAWMQRALTELLFEAKLI